MAAAPDGGTAAAAVIITGGEGAMAITMAGTATVIGESQPGPLDSGLSIIPGGMSFGKLRGPLPSTTCRPSSGGILAAEQLQRRLDLRKQRLDFGSLVRTGIGFEPRQQLLFLGQELRNSRHLTIPQEFDGERAALRAALS